MAKNDELLYWMKKSGCKMVLIGYESMNSNILKDMGKGNQQYAYFTPLKMIFADTGFAISGVERRRVVCMTLL